MSNKHAARVPRPVESERIPLKARKVSFSWEDTPLHWVPGDPFAAHTINVLHLLLPAGERWFVHGCGTCRQRVLEGEIEHRDELLTPAERGDSMLICVSRARGGRIVLDM